MVKVENIFVACNEIKVKEEIVEGGLFDELESKLKVKCAEVFALFGGNLILVCAFCNANFDDMQPLGEHLRENHSEEFFMRDDCNDEETLEVSMEIPVDPVGSPALRDTTGNESNDSLHIKSNHLCNEERPYACENCGVTYKNRRNLVRHRQKDKCEQFEVLSSPEMARRAALRIYCDNCGVSYKNRRNLVRHQKKTGCRQKGGECSGRRPAKSMRLGTEIVKSSIGLDVKAENDAVDPTTLNQTNMTDHQLPEENHLSPCETKVAESDYVMQSEDETSSKFASRPGSENSNQFGHDSTFCSEMDDKYSCNICGIHHQSEEALNLHLEGHENNKETGQTDTEWSCFPCGRQFDSKKALSNHQRRHKQFANTKPQIPKEPTENETNIPKNPDLYCDLCNRYFKNKQSLHSHVGAHDSLPQVLQDDPDILKCKFCYQEFSKYADRKAHESTHTGSRPYECLHCRKGFASNLSRKSHTRIHTGESPFRCDRCFKVFRDKYDLNRHIERHLNIRNVACELCEKRFYHKHQLELHMRTHTKERPYVCEDCGKTFVVLPQLKDHQLRHIGIKNVKCEVCGRLFYSKSVLKVHMASHSDEKPFECNVCGRRFSRAKAMQKHMKLHSGVKKYVCNICGKAYAQDSGLYAHKKTHARQM